MGGDEGEKVATGKEKMSFCESNLFVIVYLLHFEISKFQFCLRMQDSSSVKRL